MEDTAKRVRDEPLDFPDEEWPEAKRLRAAGLILLGILDDGSSASPDPAAGDIDNVMRSLEEEIAAPLQQQQPEEDVAPPPPPPSTSDLGYLLEASDDELGLPPTAPPPFSGCVEATGRGDFGWSWGLADETPANDDALGFGGLEREDESLFDLDDVAPYWPSDFLDLPRLAESLSAV